MFRNKIDESGNVFRNKAKLEAQDYNQIKRINFKKIFTPVARLEAIHMTLACACYKGFKLFQMDVNSAFLDRYIEEVYVKQPSGVY